MPNRFICDVFSEMRECVKTLNFSYLLGLVEEAQTLANRMESALHDNNDIGYIHERVCNLKKEKKTLKKEIMELEDKKDKLEEEVGDLELKQGFVKNIEEKQK